MIDPPKKFMWLELLRTFSPQTKSTVQQGYTKFSASRFSACFQVLQRNPRLGSIKTWGVFEVCMSNFCPSKPPCVFFKHMFKTARLVLTGCDFFFLGGLGKRVVFCWILCRGFPGWLWIRIDLHPPQWFWSFLFSAPKMNLGIPYHPLSPLVTRIGESFFSIQNTPSTKNQVSFRVAHPCRSL